MVSKYIGETEQNLAQVLAAAEHWDAILFLDEAGALLASRPEVRDAHERSVTAARKERRMSLAQGNLAPRPATATTEARKSEINCPAGCDPCNGQEWNRLAGTSTEAPARRERN